MSRPTESISQTFFNMMNFAIKQHESDVYIPSNGEQDNKRNKQSVVDFISWVKLSFEQKYEIFEILYFSFSESIIDIISDVWRFGLFYYYYLW